MYAELTTEEARQLFAGSFVEEWNSGRLATKYYAGLVQVSGAAGQVNGTAGQVSGSAGQVRGAEGQVMR